MLRDKVKRMASYLQGELHNQLPGYYFSAEDVEDAINEFQEKEYESLKEGTRRDTNYLELNMGQEVTFQYVNYRGFKSMRKVEVIKMYYGESEYHDGKQFFLVGLDIDKQQPRAFAINDITHLAALDRKPKYTLEESKAIVIAEFEKEIANTYDQDKQDNLRRMIRTVEGLSE